MLRYLHHLGQHFLTVATNTSGFMRVRVAKWSRESPFAARWPCGTHRICPGEFDAVREVSLLDGWKHSATEDQFTKRKCAPQECVRM
mmetsp:Transcript_30415/g.94382  ORF Transcript_30415/g.94382 Transcript_30415/m.94382 type:complete len:87 (-) Transcript_30415:1465-1725(-)